MKLFELINPSDPYTFFAPSIEIAAVAVYSIFGGSYGARDVDANETTPVLFGWNDWLDDRGIDKSFQAEHAAEIADALDSFLIGDAATRRDIEELLADVSPEKRDAWKQKRQEERRSSLNRIGEAASAAAAKYRSMYSVAGEQK